MSFQSARSPYLNRRRALGIFSGAVASAVLVGCNNNEIKNDSTIAPTDSTTTDSIINSSNSTSGGSCTVIPEETTGPYPGDGSNGPDVLQVDGIVRSDIRSSIGSASGVADGLDLRVELTILDSTSGCAPLAGAAVYLWHADSQGRYSMYSSGVENENYLRGVQVADEQGKLTFTTIHPGCYDGRWPHIHFEIYRTLDDVAAGNLIATSQLAFPAESCAEVYAVAGYETSQANFAHADLSHDIVFSDGVEQQLATMSGSVNSGLTASLSVTV